MQILVCHVNLIKFSILGFNNLKDVNKRRTAIVVEPTYLDDGVVRFYDELHCVCPYKYSTSFL